VLLTLSAYWMSCGRKALEFASVTEDIDTNTAGGRMFYAMLAAMAQYESEIISERTKAGQAAAKPRGKHIGRPSGLTTYQLTEARKMHDKGQTMRDIAPHFNVDYSPVRRVRGRK
jgi:DNA invertase Pin-like site-specific DNA recombinase